MDQVASLHLFCGATAASELLKESKHVSKCSVLLDGGYFAIPHTFSFSHPVQCDSKRYFLKENSVSELLRGRVLLTRSTEKNMDSKTFNTIPRSRCLVFQTDVFFSVESINLQHGESETRFFAIMNEYVIPAVQRRPHMNSHGMVTQPQSPHRVNPASEGMTEMSQTVII